MVLSNDTICLLQHFAWWEILHEFFKEKAISKDSFRNTIRVSSILDRSLRLGLILVQTVCKDYAQTTLTGKSYSSPYYVIGNFTKVKRPSAFVIENGIIMLDMILIDFTIRDERLIVQLQPGQLQSPLMRQSQQKSSVFLVCWNV